MPTAVPTFVYDGDCAFCTACARFIERHIPGPSTVVPFQFADLGALDLTREQCEHAVQWVGPDGVRAAGPDAIAELLASSTRRWRIPAALLRSGAVRRISWPVYRWVARNRDRMPGGSAACAIPPVGREPGQPGAGGSASA